MSTGSFIRNSGGSFGPLPERADLWNFLTLHLNSYGVRQSRFTPRCCILKHIFLHAPLSLFHFLRNVTLPSSSIDSNQLIKKKIVYFNYLIHYSLFLDSVCETERKESSSMNLLSKRWRNSMLIMGKKTEWISIRVLTHEDRARYISTHDQKEYFFVLISGPFHSHLYFPLRRLL